MRLSSGDRGDRRLQRGGGLSVVQRMASERLDAEARPGLRFCRRRDEWQIGMRIRSLFESISLSGLRHLGCGLVLLCAVCNSSIASPKPDGEGHITVIGSVAFRSLRGAPKETTLRIVRFIDATATREDLALLNYEHSVGDYQLWGEIEIAEKE